MTDLELNKLREIGDKGSNSEEFNFPAGLCLHRNQELYVCDDGNKRLQVFDQNLEFIKSIPLDFHPRKIKISDTTAFIRGYTSGFNVTFKTYVFDLTSWILKSKYDHESLYSGICELNSLYYSIPFKSTLTLFNYDGDIVKIIDIKRFTDIPEFLVSGVLNFIDDLVLFSQDKRYIRIKWIR